MFYSTFLINSIFTFFESKFVKLTRLQIHFAYPWDRMISLGAKKNCSRQKTAAAVHVRQ